jgi:hypothetical protein
MALQKSKAVEMKVKIRFAFLLYKVGCKWLNANRNSIG